MILRLYVPEIRQVQLLCDFTLLIQIIWPSPNFCKA